MTNTDRITIDAPVDDLRPSIAKDVIRNCPDEYTEGIDIEDWSHVTVALVEGDTGVLLHVADPDVERAFQGSLDSVTDAAAEIVEQDVEHHIGGLGEDPRIEYWPMRDGQVELPERANIVIEPL